MLPSSHRITLDALLRSDALLSGRAIQLLHPVRNVTLKAYIINMNQPQAASADSIILFFYVPRGGHSVHVLPCEIHGLSASRLGGARTGFKCSVQRIGPT